MVNALINVIGYNSPVSGGNKTLCNHKRESFYLVTTQSIKKMRMVAIMMIKSPISIKVVQIQTFEFHFRQRLELGIGRRILLHFRLLPTAHNLQKGTNRLKFNFFLQMEPTETGTKIKSN